jgi:hypothetical protein
MKRLSSTPHGSRKERANIYRKAAQIMESRLVPVTDGSCCWALAVAKDSEVVELVKDSDAIAMKRYFSAPRRFHDAYWMYGDDEGSDQNSHRILALCFMAAMVEAGDA